jgi:hypothetical protein
MATAANHASRGFQCGPICLSRRPGKSGRPRPPIFLPRAERGSASATNAGASSSPEDRTVCGGKSGGSLGRRYANVNQRMKTGASLAKGVRRINRRRAPRPVLEHLLGDRATIRRRWVCSWSARGGCIPTCAASSPRLCTTADSTAFRSWCARPPRSGPDSFRQRIRVAGGGRRGRPGDPQDARRIVDESGR